MTPTEGKTKNVSVGDESASDPKVKFADEPKIEDKADGATESTVAVKREDGDKTTAVKTGVEETERKAGPSEESMVGSEVKSAVGSELEDKTVRVTGGKEASSDKADSAADTNVTSAVQLEVGDKTEAAAVTDITTDDTAVKVQITDKADSVADSKVKVQAKDKADGDVKRLKQGDIVTFAGGSVYRSPTAEEAAAFRGSGRCKITEPVADSGVHRYHLISEGKHPNGKVYGWVDGKDIKEHPDYQNRAEGAAVSQENEICRFPVYYDSLRKRFVYVSAPFQKGIHDGADFGRCSDCKGERPFILACESGTVVQIRNSYKDTSGKFIKIESDHGDEVVTWQYKHLHEILVKTGDKIAVGEKIGIMGDTGGEYSDSGDYADHLHLDRRVRKKGEEDATSGKGRDEQSTDPIAYLSLEKTDRVAQLHKRTDFKEA